jgi:hypothetical protein
MRSCLDYWRISRYPPHYFLCEKNHSQDATNSPRNSSRHQIEDYGVGLLAVLVEAKMS